MGQEDKIEDCCASEMQTCCQVEALVSVDERGQMVLPKDLRDRANIRAGDKLALTSCQKDGKVWCVILSKADDLTDMVKVALGPVIKDIV